MSDSPTQTPEELEEQQAAERAAAAREHAAGIVAFRVERNGQLVDVPLSIEHDGPDAVEAFLTEQAGAEIAPATTLDGGTE